MSTDTLSCVIPARDAWQNPGPGPTQNRPDSACGLAFPTHTKPPLVIRFHFIYWHQLHQTRLRFVNLTHYKPNTAITCFYFSFTHRDFPFIFLLDEYFVPFTLMSDLSPWFSPIFSLTPLVAF